MPLKLIFASNNAHKLSEIQAVLPESIDLFSLRDIDFTDEIPEPYNTFEENAQIKASTIHSVTQSHVFSEDSGLVIPALDGQPGVHSARYAGNHKSDIDNLNKVLHEMTGMTDRAAYYLSHICLIWHEEIHHFQGKCHGTIAHVSSGSGGFGYDPIFIPHGFSQTFGELDMKTKLAFSHRTESLKKMTDWLRDNIS